MASRYDYNVFINCPFDAAYGPMLYALIFAVHDCGFEARCTLEIDDAGRVRIDNIFALIHECRFAIHDISRTELDEEYRLPRFNMPLELGVFLGAARFGSGGQKEKGCLILDREQYRYQKYISDIAERHGWFMDELPELREADHLDPDELTFSNFQTLLVEWLRLHDW